MIAIVYVINTCIICICVFSYHCILRGMAASDPTDIIYNNKNNTFAFWDSESQTQTNKTNASDNTYKVPKSTITCSDCRSRHGFSTKTWLAGKTFTPRETVRKILIIFVIWKMKTCRSHWTQLLTLGW